MRALSDLSHRALALADLCQHHVHTCKSNSNFTAVHVCKACFIQTLFMQTFFVQSLCLTEATNSSTRLPQVCPAQAITIEAEEREDGSRRTTR